MFDAACECYIAEQRRYAMRWKTAVIACLGLAALSASAQVHRCKDGAGKTVYSDQPCASGQAGQLIERQKTREEIYRERVQAYDAETKKQQRNQIAMEREQQEKWRRSMNTPQQTFQPQPKGYAERLAERNAGVGSKPVARAVQRPQFDEPDEPQPQASTRINSCNEFGCRDTGGQTYKRSVVEGVYKGPNGNCRMVGNSMRC